MAAFPTRRLPPRSRSTRQASVHWRRVSPASPDACRVCLELMPMEPPDQDDVRHAWDVSPEEAVAIQRRLAPLAANAAPTVNLDDVRTVAGVDASYPAHSHAG